MILHIDRRAEGLELFFAGRSEMFRDMAALSMEEAAERLREEPFAVRLPAASAMRAALTALKESNAELTGLMPPEILSMAEKSWQELLEGDAIMPFIEWLSKLHTENAQNKTLRLASLNHSASRLDMYSRSFVETFFALNNQRVVINREGDDLIISTAERDWGRVRAVFSGLNGAELPPMPMPGFAYCTEIKICDEGGFEVGLLIDTDFTNNEYSLRLMQDFGWQEFSFRCSDIHANANCCDYVGRLDRRGTPRSELVEAACLQLLSKYNLLGKTFLSEGERAMLPFASLLRGINGLLDDDSSISPDACDALIISALDDRWSMRRLISELEETGCAKLAQLLQAAEEANYEDNQIKALKLAETLGVAFDHALEDGSARAFYKRLADECILMTAGYDGVSRRHEAEGRALDAIKKSAEPIIRSMGFSGSFPNYRRRRKDRLEYISIMLYDRGDRPFRGVISYLASVAAGSTAKAQIDKFSSKGVSFDESNAFDCLPEAYGASLYGELACDDDGVDICLDVLASENAGYPIIRDESKKLEEYIRYAQKQLDNKRLPKKYRHKRREAAFSYGAYRRAFLRALPWTLILLIISLFAYMLIPGVSAVIPLSRPLTALVSIGAAALFNTAASALSCVVRSESIWRY